jgi:steroid delta-isomerase-like uncharacterized protein
MVSWLDDYLDAWNRHDAAAIGAFMTEDAVYTDVALGESHSGRLSVVRHVEHISERMSSNYVLEKLYGLSTDAGYVLEWVMKGTHDRSSRRLRATGLPFSVRGVSVGELEDGRIVRNTDYWNVAELLSQVRVAPVLA